MLTRFEENKIAHLVRQMRKRYTTEEIAKAFMERTLENEFAEIGHELEWREFDPHIFVWLGYEAIIGKPVATEEL